MQDDLDKSLDRAKLDVLLTQMDEGVILAGPDLRIILVNRKAGEIFNCHPSEAIGKQLSGFLQNQELLALVGDHRVSAANQAEFTAENGHVYQAQITRVSDIGLVITLHDISRLKELDRIKGDFVNNVSHDLRTPLTAILGYIELIERAGPTTDLQKEFIRRVQISVQSITALINDLLDLGRIEAGFDTRKENIDLSTIIQYIVDGQRSRLEEMSQSLVVENGANLPLVLGNPIQLRQMLNNLISNAIKYSPVGGTISILTRFKGGQIIIQVSDNGKGIPTEEQPFIFEKFYRASNISADHPGTGLGLAIVKSIVENHNGRIWVDSTPGQGAAFTIVLPAIE